MLGFLKFGAKAAETATPLVDEIVRASAATADDAAKAAPGFFGWARSGAPDIVSGGKQSLGGVKQTVSGGWKMTKGTGKIATGGAVIGGAAMAFNGTGRALNETVFSGNSAEQDAADTSPVASAMGNLGKSFGIGSAIAAGIGLLAGYMGLESPMLGMGLAAVGAFVGQPIFDAISSSMNTPAPPVSGQAVDKAPVKAPAQEQSPTLSPEAKQQAEAARNNAVSGGQTAATSAAQTIPAPAQSTATAPSVP